MSGPAPLRIELKPSYLLAGLLGLAHVLALGAAWVSLAGWPRYLVATGILISLAVCVAGALHRRRDSMAALELRADGDAAWMDGDGRWHDCRVAQDHFVSPLLVVLALERDGAAQQRVVLLPDSAAAEDLRRLRVWLRWRPGAGAGGGKV